jgi:bifunctional UDP-N-acetylglucosamine pyrophosphorylase/glucosamine-1-phosphate N-acetyltransferase
MKAVILAAGEGTRLKPITLNRPKPLIRINGKTILEHTISILKNLEITEIIVITNYREKDIKEYFNDGKKHGVKIQYKKQEKINGTAFAVNLVEPIIEDDFILIYGDLLFNSAVIKKIINLFKTKNADAVLAVTPVDNPEKYGIVELDKEKRIKKIIEKPKNNISSNLANTGIYVLTKDIFKKIKKIKKSKRGEYELTDAIKLMINEKKKVIAELIEKENWIDIANPWDLLEANSWILQKQKRKIYGTIEEGAHIIGSVTISKNTRIRSGAYIEGPAFIDEDTEIGPNCYIRPYTSIGKKVRIGNAVEIKNSIIMDKTHVGHLSYVGDSIICERCNLGAGTIIANYRFDSKSVKMKVKNKIINTKRRKLGAILGDDVKTGIHAVLLPGVKVGNKSWIGVKYIVDRDIAENTCTTIQQKKEKNKKSAL